MTKNAIILEKIKDVAIFTLDAPNQTVNIMNKKSFLELSELVSNIEKDKDIRSVIIISAKESNFIAGADIHELMAASSAEEATSLCLFAQDLFNTIENSKKTYIAAVHGSCFGGGLELALACHFRIATNTEKTIFSFPEVNVGFLPAAGGTQRLPALIGIKASLEMLVLGKQVAAARAHSLGLVDSLIFDPAELRSTSLSFAQKKLRKKGALRARQIWALPLLWWTKRKIKQKTFGLYPAPLAIIDAVKTGIMQGFKRGLKYEADTFGKLTQGPQSKNLVKLFFAQKARRKNPYQLMGNSPEELFIAGSGLMGSGIAYVSLLKNFSVHVNDNNQASFLHTKDFITQKFKERIARNQLSKFHSNRLLGKLKFSQDFSPISTSDAVVEAIYEDVEVKKALFKQIEPLLKPGAIVATNTSSIPLSDLTQNSGIKDRIVGMHYFSPVHKMPLLEIVRGQETSEQTLAKACDIGLRQGKTIIVVNDSPGFYTTRVVASLFDEACIMLLEGVSARSIDQGLRRVGFPMGPLALMDEIGLDVALHVCHLLKNRLGTRLIAGNLDFLDAMVQKGMLGRKTKRGMYCYNKGRKSSNFQLKKICKKMRTPQSRKNSIQIEDRLMLRVVNEAAFCLSENIVKNEQDGDIGAVLGIGFPPHLSGPFTYIAQQGQKKIIHLLDQLKEQYGERFTKAPFFTR